MNYESWNNFLIEDSVKVAVDLNTLRSVNNKLLGANANQSGSTWNPADNKQAFEDQLHGQLKGMYGEDKSRSMSRFIARTAVDSLDEDKSQSANPRAKNYIDVNDTPKQIVNDIRKTKVNEAISKNRAYNRDLIDSAKNSAERQLAREQMKTIDPEELKKTIDNRSIEKSISDKVQRRIDVARKKHPIIRIGSYRYKPGEEFMLEATKAHEISEARTPVLENYNNKTKVIKRNPGTVYSGLAVNSGHAGPQPLEDMIRASSATGVGSKDYRKAEFARRTGDVQVMTNTISDPKLKSYLTRQYYGMDGDSKVFDKSVQTVLDQREKHNQRLQDYIDKRNLKGSARKAVEDRMKSTDPAQIRQELIPKRMNRNMKNHILRTLDNEILNKPNLWKSTHKFDMSDLDHLKDLTKSLR